MPFQIIVLDQIFKIINAECNSAGTPEPPKIEPTTSFPLTGNDSDLFVQIQETFESFFGPQKIKKLEKLPGSEDVSNLAKTRSHTIPYFFWFAGSTEPHYYDDLEQRGQLNQLARTHSSKFAPDIETTMKTTVQALALAALRFLVK
jgi:metal-dependent amidase/aminoacylase/carboxypeptidase family protein